MGKIIVLGSINMDVVVMAARHPQAGETVFGRNVHFIPGGKGANQAVAASRLSDDVQLVGKLGRDAFGAELHQFLQRENLDLQYLHFSETTPSGTALITVDDHSENRIVVVSGSNGDLTADDVAHVDVAADDLLVSVFETPQPAIRALFQKANAVGARTLLNPAPAAPFAAGLRDLCDFLVVNETELAYFVGESPDSADLARLKRQAATMRSHDDQTVVVTLGSQGVVCLHADQFLVVPGRRVNAVDTTAAGDCFVGALAVGLLEGQSMADALAFANVAASLSVQHIGASTSLPYRREVDAAQTE
jgi:ribokinase